MFCFKIIFYAYFFPFLSEEKEMKLTFFECAKERKRNRCDHTDKNARITRLAFLRNICSAKAERIFRTFRKKSFDCVEKKYSKMIPADVCTRFTVSSCEHPQKIRSKARANFEYMKYCRVAPATPKSAY